MLRKLQQDVQISLLKSLDEARFTALCSNGKLTIHERLAIYRHNNQATLLRTLAEHYPVCKKLVGDKAFGSIAKQYIALHPSKEVDLNSYGANLAVFIQTLPYLAQVPYLADVAKLEWSCHRTSLMPVDKILDFSALAKVSNEFYEALIFELAPSVSLVSSAYPIHEIWEFNQADYQGPNTLSLAEGGVKLIVWSSQATMHMQTLDDLAWQLLMACKLRATLGEVFQQLTLESAITPLLAEFIRLGWISDYTIKAHS
jgi:hypothetical protein